MVVVAGFTFCTDEFGGDPRIHQIGVVVIPRLGPLAEPKSLKSLLDSERRGPSSSSLVAWLLAAESST